MIRLIPDTQDMWAVCHGPSVIHIAEVKVGQQLETGQPNCDHFYTKQEAISRAKEIDPDWEE